jgi:AGZA family xanthine/uracil permease-like MFS transporter
MTDLIGKMKDQGVLYDGLRVLGGGSILGGLILGAIAVFIIDRNFMKASMFSLAGAALTFLGFMHGEKIGFGESPVMALSYLGVAGVLFACARSGAPAKAPMPMPDLHGGPEPLPAAE